MLSVRSRILEAIRMNENEKKLPLIRIKNLYKIFGKNEKKILEQVKAGQSKDTILAETGIQLVCLILI